MILDSQSKLLELNGHGETLPGLSIQSNSGKESCLELQNLTLDNECCKGHATSMSAWDNKMAFPIQKDIREEQHSPKLNDYEDRESPSSLTYSKADTEITSNPACIVICGMAVRLPNRIKTPQQLWHFLLNKGDARSWVPESRYNVSLSTTLRENRARLSPSMGTSWRTILELLTHPSFLCPEWSSRESIHSSDFS